MGYEQQIHEQALALGGEVAAALKPARAYLQRADELNRQLEAARKAEEAEYAKQVEAAVTTGELPSPNGFHWGWDSPPSKMAVAAVAACHANATASGRAAAPALFSALVARVAAVVAESVKLTKSLPDHVVNERTAIRAGKDQYDVWVRLGELIDDWEAAHELNRVLQRAGWINGPDGPHDRPGAGPFEAYLAPPPLRVIPRVARERHLAAAVQADAGPALIDWPTAAARWEKLDRRQRIYSPGSVVQRVDSWGRVLEEEASPERPSAFVPAPSQ